MSDDPPEKAVILAAGYGTRMLPVTRVLPKPLLPLWNVPMLEHALRLVKRWGVTEVLVNCHHGADQVVDFMRRRSRQDGFRVSLSYEPDVLGTGGVLRRAEWFLDERPFWMLNADVAADVSPENLVRRPPTRRVPASLWLVPDRGPRTVEVKGGKVVTFRSRCPGSPDTATFSGLHLIHPRILDFLPDAGFASIIEAYEQAMAEGLTIRGVTCSDSYWADVGTPENYLETHRDLFQCKKRGLPGMSLVEGDPTAAMRVLRKRGVAVTGFAAIAETATVEPGAALHDAVLLPGSHIGRRGRVTHAMVASEVSIQSAVTRLATSAVLGLESHERAALASCGWDIAKASASISVPRGSSRQFVRLHQGRRKAILVRYTSEREENSLYARHARFLSSLSIRVPRVLYDDPANKWTLYEDLGDRSLLALVAKASDVQRRRLYETVLESVMRLHQLGARAARRRRIPLMAPFNKTLYRWEYELFAEHILRGRLGLTPCRVTDVLRELSSLSLILSREPDVLVHRDLQSSNVYFLGRAPALIDFQGMRFGPAAYDLASLLADPYVCLPHNLQHELLHRYNQNKDLPDVSLHTFQVAVVQRLTQALGAFGRLAKVPGNESFARYIVPSAEHLLEVVPRLDVHLEAFRSTVAELVGNEKKSGDPDGSR